MKWTQEAVRRHKQRPEREASIAAEVRSSYALSEMAGGMSKMLLRFWGKNSAEAPQLVLTRLETVSLMMHN